MAYENVITWDSKSSKSGRILHLKPLVIHQPPRNNMHTILMISRARRQRKQRKRKPRQTRMQQSPTRMQQRPTRMHQKQKSRKQRMWKKQT